MKYKEQTFLEFKEGKTYQEAADALGLSKDAITKKINQAHLGSDERVYTIDGEAIYRAVIKLYPLYEGYKPPRIKGS